MREASVQIRLLDEADGPGVTGNTWVVVVPVRRSYPSRTSGVAMAAGEAVALFIESIMREREAVAEKLIRLENGDV